jgi:hypothetical protein
MNTTPTNQTGLSGVIVALQKQKDELTLCYNEAISNGEKLHEVRTLYLSLKDVDKRLNELLSINL